MTTQIDRLKTEIARLEPLHGSDDPFVKDMKEQLRACEANKGMTAFEVYQAQSVNPTSQSEDLTPGEVRNLGMAKGMQSPEFMSAMDRQIDERLRYLAEHGSNKKTPPKK